MLVGFYLLHYVVESPFLAFLTHSLFQTEDIMSSKAYGGKPQTVKKGN